MRENKYYFKTLNKFEYEFIYDVFVKNKLLNLAFEKSIKGAKIINRNLDKLEIPEYFEITPEQYKLAKIVLRKEISKQLKTISFNISNKTKKEVILFEPTLKEGKYKKIDSSYWNIILTFRGIYQEK